MKKLISAFTMMFLCSLSYAESMKFITVLSSPVGTFNKLEAVDPAQPAKGNTVNFCTNIGTQGVVELKGTKPAALTTVVLSNNTTLGKTDEGKFSLNNITLKQGGNIRGGRLFGNTVTVNNAASGKANNLYGNTLTVAGAKTSALDVGSGNSTINGPGDSTGKEEMVWSNEYQDDDACKSGSACVKQYLLKEKGNAVTPEPKEDCSVRSYKLANKSKCCPGTPTSDGDCWLAPSYEWGAKKNFSGTFTVTFTIDGVQGNCYEAATAGPSVYKTLLPQEMTEWWILNCGSRNNSNKPTLNQSCSATNTPEGLVLPICYYTVNVGAVLGHDYDIVHTGCTRKTSTECECTASRWPGHECVEKPAQKNGW